MNEILSVPCMACPYRKDVPSGIWNEAEYDKLIEYDRETMNQPLVPFACHAHPSKLCHGWSVCHSNRGHDHELIALRLLGIDPSEIPAPRIKLFASGQEAADHGKKDIPKPKLKARRMMIRLLKRYARLREGNDDERF